VGLGIEILFVLILGLLVLGPKRLHTMLAHVARAKAELENATRGLKSQLAAELDAARGAGKTDCSHVLLGDCDLCSTFKSVPECREPENDCAKGQSSIGRARRQNASLSDSLAR
jgi:Sec-independent protein translocase protein TatA